LPLSARSVDTSIPFSATEQLFRRVLPSEELTDGEIDPTRFNSVSFKKGVDGAPSVLRGRFSEPADALHRDCAGQKDVSNQFVYSISVGELPEEIHSDDGKHFSIYPLHLPEPTCGAHSVISSCRKGDDSGTYVVPSPSARNHLRTWLATQMRKVRFASEPTSNGSAVTNP
jgi:hypothetical protein